MKIKLFLVVCLVYELTSLQVYELTSLRVNKLFVAIMICVIRSSLMVHIIKFKVQSSKFKVQSPNLFYISGQEKVRNGVEN